MDIKTKYNIDDKIIVKDPIGNDTVVSIHSVTVNVRKKLSGVCQMVLYGASKDQMSKLGYSVLECDVVPHIEPSKADWRLVSSWHERCDKCHAVRANGSIIKCKCEGGNAKIDPCDSCYYRTRCEEKEEQRYCSYYRNYQAWKDGCFGSD